MTKRKWSAACDIDYEQGDGDTPAQIRWSGFEWQAEEAVRLATKSKMLKAEPDKIDKTVLALAQRATSAWADLTTKLKREHRKHR